MGGGPFQQVRVRSHRSPRRPLFLSLGEEKSQSGRQPLGEGTIVPRRAAAAAPSGGPPAGSAPAHGSPRFPRLSERRSQGPRPCAPPMTLCTPHRPRPWATTAFPCAPGGGAGRRGRLLPVPALLLLPSSLGPEAWAAAKFRFAALVLSGTGTAPQSSQTSGAQAGVCTRPLSLSGTPPPLQFGPLLPLAALLQPLFLPPTCSALENFLGREIVL